MDDNLKDKSFETKAIHTGHVPEDNTGSVTSPIYTTSTYKERFPGDDEGYVYSRWSNPTRSALEETLAAIEGGKFAYAYASGLAALNAVVGMLQSGDHVVAVDDLYGGTHRQFERHMKKFGLEFTYVNGEDYTNFEKAVKDNTKLFWVETPTNPLLKLTDIEKVAAIAKKHDIILGVDNTFATPYLQHPLSLGADIVMHSMSKYLGGHCDIIGGCLVTNDDELAEKIRFSQYAVGSMLSPFDCYLVQRGIKTLHLRMERHCFNASKVAEYLDKEALVAKVYYPGLNGQPLPNKMKYGGGMVSFELDADLETVKKFAMSTKLFVLAESLGGVESLLNHPALMTHASIPKEIREANGIKDSLIRLSVGIENIDDLLNDLQQAFASVKESVKQR